MAVRRPLILNAKGGTKQATDAELPDVLATIGGAGAAATAEALATKLTAAGGDASATKLKLPNAPSILQLDALVGEIGSIPASALGLVDTAADQTAKFTAAIADACLAYKKPIMGLPGAMYRVGSRLAFPAKSGFVSKRGGLIARAVDFNNTSHTAFGNLNAAVVLLSGDDCRLEAVFDCDFKNTTDIAVDAVQVRGRKRPVIRIEAFGLNTGFGVRADTIEDGEYHCFVHDGYMKRSSAVGQMSAIQIDGDIIGGVQSTNSRVFCRAERLYGDPAFYGTNIQTDGLNDQGGVATVSTVYAFEVGEALDTFGFGGHHTVYAERTFTNAVKVAQRGSGNRIRGLIKGCGGFGVALSPGTSANKPGDQNDINLKVVAHGAMTKIPGPNGDTTFDALVGEVLRVDDSGAFPNASTSRLHNDVVELDIYDTKNGRAKVYIAGAGETVNTRIRIRHDGAGAPISAASFSASATGFVLEEEAGGVRTIWGKPNLATAAKALFKQDLLTGSIVVDPLPVAGTLSGGLLANKINGSVGAPVRAVYYAGGSTNADIRNVYWGVYDDNSVPKRFVIGTSNGGAAADRYFADSDGFYPAAHDTYSIGKLGVSFRTGFFSRYIVIDQGPYADDAAAGTAGVPVTGLYRKTGGSVAWRQT